MGTYCRIENFQLITSWFEWLSGSHFYYLESNGNLSSHCKNLTTNHTSTRVDILILNDISSLTKNCNVLFKIKTLWLEVLLNLMKDIKSFHLNHDTCHQWEPIMCLQTFSRLLSTEVLLSLIKTHSKASKLS